VPISLTGAETDQLGERSPRRASRSWRQRPRGQQGFSYFSAWWLSAAAGRRRSGRCRWHGFPPAPPRAARPSFLWDALATKSQSCPSRGGGGGGGGGCGCELVVAPLRASEFLRRGRRHLRCFGLLPAPCRAIGHPFLWDFFTSDGGTAKRRHG
jgi:hypothetical protein